MDTHTIKNTVISIQHHPVTNRSGKSPGEKTTQGISVIPPEQVSPLMSLPNELLVKIAGYLPFADFRNLDLTNRRLSTLFNTEVRLKILAFRYYASLKPIDK
ncbi:F-box protein [Endozoicomonas sp. ONNA2]|uniref:F-box protein n=1 Tax=Endozoicomonas sp. ONNA2 TaxID=2828741 RepID=UPI002147F00D|nr:F-box protein [Endozoicomonas sp. ONNA2]